MRLPDGAPADEAALLARAERLVGRSLGALAEAAGGSVPADLRRAKGWVGQLVERALGAPGGAAAGPDFPRLGIELKTVPIDARGQPRGSTFVCTATLESMDRRDWRGSAVRAKLARVLWIPVQAAPSLPLAARRLGSPLLWSPDPAEEATLREDWEELSELIALGYVRSISATRGRWLQLRPKGQNARARTTAPDPDGALSPAPVRAFYLRRTMLQHVLSTRFWMTGG